MKTLNDLNRKLAMLGCIKNLPNLALNPQWQWVPILLMFIGYLLAPSEIFEINVESAQGWVKVLLVSCVVVFTGGGSVLVLAKRKTDPIVARWGCLAALAPLWLPTMVMVNGLPTLITSGLVMGLTLMSCNVACTVAPIQPTPPTD
jgi:drug/metabolite transporter (DMT)-like permease